MLKQLLLTAPDSQLDSSMFPLIEKWDDPEPTALQLLEVIDHCIFSALSSGVVLAAMQYQMEARLKEEGKTLNDLLPFAVWRTEPFFGYTENN